MTRQFNSNAAHLHGGLNRLHHRERLLRHEQRSGELRRRKRARFVPLRLRVSFPSLACGLESES